MSVRYVQVSDSKGRIVIPKVFRDKLGVMSGTLLQITETANGIILTKIVESEIPLSGAQLNFQTKVTTGSYEHKVHGE